jgi:hypothetical protein
MIKWLFRNNPSLLGDLLEERTSGRSRAWYWRQVAIAVARSIGSSSRQHPVLMARAIATAVVAYMFTAVAVAIGEGYTYGYLMGWSKVDAASLFIVLPIAIIPTAFTGFLVARTHRSCAEAATVAIIILWTATSVPVHDWFWIAETASILGGAALGSKQREPST